MSADATRAALRWLEQREPPPPFELQRRLQRVVERTAPGATLQDVLLSAAFDSLRNAMRIGDDRTAANDLLAADALLTYCIEDAAEHSLEQLGSLLARLEVGRFQALLEPPA